MDGTTTNTLASMYNFLWTNVLFIIYKKNSTFNFVGGRQKMLKVIRVFIYFT